MSPHEVAVWFLYVHAILQVAGAMGMAAGRWVPWWPQAVGGFAVAAGLLCFVGARTPTGSVGVVASAVAFGWAALVTFWLRRDLRQTRTDRGPSPHS